MKHSLILVNPYAGKGKYIDIVKKYISYLQESEKIFDLHYTAKKYDALNFTKEHSAKYDVILIFGGDGTINEVINGLQNNSKSALLLIPVGSGNDTARALSLSLNGAQYVQQRIEKGSVKLIDRGRAEFQYEDGSKETRYFISSCGFGFDALVSRASNTNNNDKGLKLYLKSVFSALKNIYPFYVNFSSEGNKLQHLGGSKILVNCGNTRTAGGGFALNPNASITDGFLDIMGVESISKLKLITLLPKAISGSHLNRKEVVSHKFHNLNLSFDKPIHSHCDGEPNDNLVIGAELSVEPGILNFIV